jgi:hypothetical protein
MKCRIFDQRWLMAGVVKEMRRVAMTGLWRADGFTDYLHRCHGYHRATGTKIGFTRDLGHHTSGWWKNPDYENCFHLSLSFYDPESGTELGDRDVKLTQEWIDLFFGDHKRLLWAEPPYSELGKKLDTWHYRLFMHSDWQTPLLPRKEVYSKEFTEAGWKSWSDVQAEIEQRQNQIVEQLGNQL